MDSNVEMLINGGSYLILKKNIHLHPLVVTAGTLVQKYGMEHAHVVSLLILLLEYIINSKQRMTISNFNAEEHTSILSMSAQDITNLLHEMELIGLVNIKRDNGQVDLTIRSMMDFAIKLPSKNTLRQRKFRANNASAKSHKSEDTNQIYEYYECHHKKGLKSSAIININKLLSKHQIPKNDIIQAIDNYEIYRIKNHCLDDKFIKEPSNFFTFEYLSNFLPAAFEKSKNNAHISKTSTSSKVDTESEYKKIQETGFKL